MEELLKIVQWQKEHGWKNNIELTSQLVTGCLEDIIPFLGKIKFKSYVTKGGYLYPKSHTKIYQKNGIKMSYYPSRLINNNTRNLYNTCAIDIVPHKSVNHNYQRYLTFVVKDEDEGMLLLRKIFTIQDFLYKDQLDYIISQNKKIAVS